jgi:uncharacterized protein YndB with AHSA1/START domain
METHMAETFVARVSATINASREKVWNALVDPEVMKLYMPLTSVASEWRVNSSIVWKGELEGKPLETRGTVLRLEPERMLEYSHTRPIFRASRAVPPESHRVTIELSGGGGQTNISVTELGNATEREHAHSEGGWRLALANMKAVLEGASVV